MNFLETRITKLEAQFEEKEMDISDTNLELYDVNGQKVDAKILQMPKDWEPGLAILSNGSEKEIAPIGNWRDIIFASERLDNSDEIVANKAEQEDYSDKLFLRRDNQVTAVEMIYGNAKND